MMSETRCRTKEARSLRKRQRWQEEGNCPDGDPCGEPDGDPSGHPDGRTGGIVAGWGEAQDVEGGW